MQITMLTIGSRGDLQPFIALGLGLWRAGHSIRLATHRPYKDFVEANGLEFAQLSGDPGAILEEENARQWLETGSNPITFTRQLVRLTKDRMQDILKDSLEACQGADLIIYSTLAFPGYHIAEQLDIPVYAGYLQPLTRSRYVPPITLPTSWNLGSALNWAGHHLVEQLIWQPYRTEINDWRMNTLHLPSNGIWGPFRRLYEDCTPFLYGFSHHVIPKPQDWPECHHITGYWFLETEVDWKPPDGLLNFLNDGSPPVYVGFGSMSTRDPSERAELILDALNRTGQRGLILTGWGGLSNENTSDDIYVINAAPHAWLFPRMRAVVHHGGAGTTAAGLRAGVPGIVLPFFGDQPFWGRRIYELGVGPKPIQQNKLTAEKLAGAINRTVSDLKMQERARDLGELIQGEDGIGQAVKIIEQRIL